MLIPSTAIKEKNSIERGSSEIWLQHRRLGNLSVGLWDVFGDNIFGQRCKVQINYNISNLWQFQNILDVEKKKKFS